MIFRKSRAIGVSKFGYVRFGRAVLDNVGSMNERSGYSWKEYSSLGSDKLYVQCCDLPHSAT